MKRELLVSLQIIFATVMVFHGGCSDSSVTEDNVTASAGEQEANQANDGDRDPATSFAKEGVAGNCSVHVIVKNVQPREGRITAALYDCEQSYKNGGSVRGKRVAVKGETVEFDFSDLPEGEFAIRLFHDINENQEMDTNAYGMPTEPFAFSNNARGTMGPPSWDAARFSVSGHSVHEIAFPKRAEAN